MYTDAVEAAPNNTFFGSEPGGREAAPGPLALVQAFVNTGATEGQIRWEAIGDPDSLRSWLVRRGLLAEGKPVGESDVSRALGVREALRAMLAANNGHGLDPGVVRVLNGAVERANIGVRFGEDGSTTLRSASGGVDGALGVVLARVHAGMEEGTWERLKACANGGCGWAFYDRSKNRSGRWCSMEVCGNRSKTRAYRRRSANQGS